MRLRRGGVCLRNGVAVPGHYELVVGFESVGGVADPLAVPLRDNLAVVVVLRSAEGLGPRDERLAHLFVSGGRRTTCEGVGEGPESGLKQQAWNRSRSTP